MNKRRAILKALRGALGRDGANAAIGAVIGGGTGAATGGDALNIGTNALNGAIIGANYRGLRKIGIDMARSGAAKKKAAQAATRPRTNASPISVVDNEFDAPVRAAPKKKLSMREERAAMKKRREEAYLRSLGIID